VKKATPFNNSDYIMDFDDHYINRNSKNCSGTKEKNDRDSSEALGTNHKMHAH
jgi:hypothetical protein